MLTYYPKFCMHRSIYMKRFWDKVNKQEPDDCWEWKSTIIKGYGKFCLKYKQVMAHRLSYCLSNNISLDDIKDTYVLHKCDNRKCCNPYHLFLGSLKDNMQDCLSKGRFANKKGSKNNSAKLNEQQVFEIRILLNQKLSQYKIAKLYRVSQGTISEINTRKIWNHI